MTIFLTLSFYEVSFECVSVYGFDNNRSIVIINNIVISICRKYNAEPLVMRQSKRISNASIVFALSSQNALKNRALFLLRAKIKNEDCNHA